MRRRALAAWIVVAGIVASALLPAAVLARDTAVDAATLRARHAALQPALRDNPFGEPLVIVSKELPDHVEGEVYAELPYDFEVATAAFRTPAAVCELLFLHLNVHACTPREGGTIDLLAGPKKSGGAGMTALMHYTLRTELDTPDQLRVTMTAPTGPLSTSDYRILFEAIGLETGHSFVHFGYSHATGLLSRMAMQTYLATAGRDKIGFTVVGRDADGRPQYVKGERGSLERNVMRYYDALMAHCQERSGTPEERLQARLRTWFALTERHAAQLHEYSLEEYLDEKRRDLARIGAQK